MTAKYLFSLHLWVLKSFILMPKSLKYSYNTSTILSLNIGVNREKLPFKFNLNYLYIRSLMYYLCLFKMQLFDYLLIEPKFIKLYIFRYPRM